MATLYSLHREKSLLAAKRKQFLGREFIYGNSIVIVIDVSRVERWPLDGSHIQATVISLRWRSADLTRWRRWYPERRHHHTGTITPGPFRTARWGSGDTPLPNHTPWQCGLHILDQPA